jgi:hypothetical protein
MLMPVPANYLSKPRNLVTTYTTNISHLLPAGTGPNDDEELPRIDKSHGNPFLHE